jgi:hypothetical protein
VSAVTFCALCGTDLTDDGSRSCDCAERRPGRPDPLSTLGTVVREAAWLAAHEGTPFRDALRLVAWHRRGRA